MDAIRAIVFSFTSLCSLLVHGQTLFPAKLDGFVYEGHSFNADTIMIEAFFDPVCPYSRDGWPPLKKALDEYDSQVSLVVHPFPLPYHDNAFVTSRALHIVNQLNRSTTYNMMEMFFKHQEMFYGQPTRHMSRASIVSLVIDFISKVVGKSSLPAVEFSFNDRRTDLMTRVSFEYGCSRGVLITPFFFVNGFALPDSGGSTINYSSWRRILDPLAGRQATKRKGSRQFSL